MVEKTAEKRAKLFRNGGSQAVRLPREFQFEGTEVRIRRDGQSVVLEAVGPQIAAKDVDRVRKIFATLGPMGPEFSALVEEAIKKLES